MEIKIDIREPIELRQHIFSNCDKTTICNLPLGDVSIQTSELELIIERKTVTDLASSIRDGRLREQKIRLIHNYPKKNIIYIIEGDITRQNKSMKFNKINKYTIYSSIINMLVRDNIRLFMSNSIENTIEFIEILIKKIKKGTLKIIKYNEISEASQYSNGISLRNISSVKINKQSNITPELVYKAQLACIPSISTLTAEALMSHYTNMKHLIQSLQDKTPEERIHILQKIKTSKSRRLGSKIASNINTYIFE